MTGPSILPAYELLVQLCRESRRFAAQGRRVGNRDDSQCLVAQWRQRLTSAEHMLNGRDDYPSANMRLMVRYLSHKRLRLTTDHNTLDQFVKLARAVGDQPLMPFLQSANLNKSLQDATTKNGQGALYSKTRELYRFAQSHETKPGIPQGLGQKCPKTLPRSTYVLSPTDIIETIASILRYKLPIDQHPYTGIPVSEYVVALICISATTGARISESLALRIGDIRVGLGVAVTINGKGGKARTVERSTGLPAIPDWMVSYLQHFSHKRLSEAGGNRQAHLFTGALFSDSQGQVLDADQAHKNLTRYLARCGVEFSPHDFRRFCAQTLVANETNLLTTINILGQATLQTAPKNYLQIYPLLQRQQLGGWMSEQTALNQIPQLSLRQIAHAQAVSYETVRRSYETGRHQSAAFARGTQLRPDISLAIELAQFRITKALGAVSTQANCSRSN